MSPVGGDIMRHDQIDNRRGGELPYSPRKICEDDVTSYRSTSEDRPVYTIVGPVYMRQGSASAG